MANKSVIEVEVLDDQFKAFQAAYNKYRADLETQPKGWKQQAETIGKLPHSIDNATHSLERFRRTAQSTFGIISGTAKALVGWGVAATAIAAAGTFGAWSMLSRGATSSGDQRKRSMSNRINPGEMNTMDVYLSKMFDKGSEVYGSILDTQQDLNSQWVLPRNGIDPNGKAIDQLEQATLSLKDTLTLNPGAVGYTIAEQMGLDRLIPDRKSWNTIASLPREEIVQSFNDARADKQGLNLNDKTGKQGQEFTQAIDAAKIAMWNSFLDATANLVPRIKDLTNEFRSFMVQVEKSHSFGTLIDEAEAALARLTQWIEKGGLEKALQVTETALNSFGTGLKKLSDYMGWSTPNDPSDDKGLGDIASDAAGWAGDKISEKASKGADWVGNRALENAELIKEDMTSGGFWERAKKAWETDKEWMTKPLWGDKTQLEKKAEGAAIYRDIEKRFGTEFAQDAVPSIYRESRFNSEAINKDESGNEHPERGIGLFQHTKPRVDAWSKAHGNKEFPHDARGQIDALEWELKGPEKDNYKKMLDAMERGEKHTFRKYIERSADSEGDNKKEDVFLNKLNQQILGLKPGDKPTSSTTNTIKPNRPSVAQQRIRVEVHPAPGADYASSTNSMAVQSSY
jgi:hypothetical protein